jgi:hypothetical protein
MMDEMALLELDKENLASVSETISKEDTFCLVQWLNEKDDKIRYKALQLLQVRSQISDDVFLYWQTFTEKLKSDNSYQRSIGLMLIAENAKWDMDDRMESTIDSYLSLLADEKPITIRQCIQALPKITSVHPKLNQLIAGRLIEMDLAQLKDTMRKLILTDILYALLDIRRNTPLSDHLTHKKIDCYISNALTGEILDKKTKKLIETYI